MVRITEDLVRKSAEHNDGILSTLEEVALHQRDIERIEYLCKWCPELKILDLTSNLISRIENLGRLKKLEYLKLGLNNIERIENLEGCESLEKLDLTVNFIGELTSIECLQGLINLRELYLTGNPCTKYENYRPFVVGTLSQLERLDGLEITKSERILAFQVLFQIRDEILEQERRHFIIREKEKLKEKQKVDDDDDDDANEEEKERRFWNEPTEFTPESRNKIYQHKLKGKKDNLQKEEKESTSERKLVTAYGRRLNVNEPKVKFELTEDEEGKHLVLDVALFKYLDTSLCNVDIHPTYVQVVVRDKMLQIALSEEVNAEQSVAQRSQATGRLLITMPKVNPQLTLAKFDFLKKSKPKKVDESRIKRLEVDPSCKRTVDLSICQKGIRTDNLKNESISFKCLKEKENSEGFIDDDDVPPLESF